MMTDAAPRWSFWQFLDDELTVSPARFSQMLRMVALVAIIVVLSMALRVPEAAISGYMVFFFSMPDAASTVRVGVAAIVGATIGILLLLFIYTFACSEPALRVCLMACMTFAGMYFMRISQRAGPLGLVIGFLCAYGLTQAELLQDPERLVRALLWLWVVLVYPIALVVLSDLVFGQRPEEVFRSGIAGRLRAAGGVLGDEAGATGARAQIDRLLDAGSAYLMKNASHGGGAGASLRLALVRQTDLLLLLLHQLPAEHGSRPEMKASLARAAAACQRAERSLLGSDTGRADEVPPNDEPASSELPSPALAIIEPLFACVRSIQATIEELRHPRAGLEAGQKSAGAEPPEVAPAAAAAKRTEAARFAFKVTLAAMMAYIAYTAVKFSGIHTAMITCFFVAQASVGNTIHKFSLRLIGALIGGALGIGAIVFVLPYLESIGGLVVVVSAVTLFAAWIGTGSQRISYAGWQIAFAFYLTVLQGFARASDMDKARDRMIGILFGNLLITVIFTALWPERIGPAVRLALSRAAGSLAALIRLGAVQDGKRKVEALDGSFESDLSAARQYAFFERVEPGDSDPSRLIASLERLFIPIQAIAQRPLLESPQASADRTGREAVTSSYERIAGWLTELSKAIAGRRPAPAFDHSPAETPSSDPAIRLRADWAGLIEREIEKVASSEPDRSVPA